MKIKYLKVSVTSITSNAIKTIAAGTLLFTTLTGCGFLDTATPTPQPAQLRFTSPATGTTLKPDEIVAIQGEYFGAAIATVELWVNGASDSALEVRPRDPTLAVDWLPKTTGRQILYLEAYDQNKTVVVRSDAIVLMVDEPVPTAAPEVIPTTPAEPTAESLPSPVAMAAAVTTTSVITAAVGTTSPTSTTVAPSSAASLTIATNSVNLRSGPGTTYAPQGQLTQGQTAPVVGKSADGAWWQISVDGKKVWVFGELVQANAAAASVAVVQAPPAPTGLPTPEAAATIVPIEAPAAAAPAVATPPATVVGIIEFTPVPTVTVPEATASSAPTVAPAEDACNDANPFWAARLNGNPQLEFCTPVPFEFVPGGSADPDEMVIRWHIYGIKSVELRIDPSGDTCGIGTTGRREQVAFQENNYRLNKRDFPAGGYKVGLWATLNNGRVQDWGELHFCGK